MGRVVITHSTYVEGLIPLLRRLVRHGGIDTATPAVISRVRGRSPQLSLRISTPIRGGHKLVARRGSLVQEVFVTTSCSREDLQALLDELLQPGRSRQKARS
ncbi:hypothetical protein EVJ50_04830 [Synechococcus sp. RSCCF101]|uniref:DUF2103 domain-containing protein n=1 Tax=Synechococcus sp. RSCCF101 TaxID=2511069 RepID=UPI001247A69C|nr:DUF2103 domain-containing protein [Synechococcus sp. RSCCF101]QEY31667.1 hypothetical protein EVJ50_04830 [Synechococcus sp. RSCCF101]